MVRKYCDRCNEEINIENDGFVIRLTSHYKTSISHKIYDGCDLCNTCKQEFMRFWERKEK